MELKKLNTAQSLMAHIALKTSPLTLFGASILVRQWTASERIEYLALISEDKEETDEILLLRPQAKIVAMSMVNDKGTRLLTKDEDIEALVQNRGEETSKAFIEISRFNGLNFSAVEPGASTDEEQAVKN